MQFLVVPLGLEDAALAELQEVSLEIQRLFGPEFAIKQCEKVTGGIEFEADVQLGWAANALLKIPSRVLQRWLIFKVRDFPSLYKKLIKADWKSSLFKKGIGKIHIAASTSRLNNEKRLLKLLLEVLAEIKIAVGQVDAPDLYFRMHDDIATISVDTTGEHLHFRGYRQLQGEAPLRENYAAFLWSILIDGMSLAELADYHIIDPMAGAGTLLFEALLWDKQIVCRNYSSTAWLNAKIKETINKHWCTKPFQFQVWGFDHSQEVIVKAEENFSLLQKFYKEIENKAEFQCFDLFNKSDKKISKIQPEIFKKKRLLLSNPPYGERLKTENSPLAYCEKALDLFTPEKAVFLVPDRKETRAVKSLGKYNKVLEKSFLNNGIKVLVQKWSLIGGHL